MTFNEFNKEDLDFSGLISKPTEKPKLPRPSEGLRFLNRNLKKDYEIRKTTLVSAPPTLSEKPNETLQQKSSIDKNDTLKTEATLLKTSIDISDTPNNVSKTTIDDNDTPITVSETSIDKNLALDSSAANPTIKSTSAPNFNQSSELGDVSAIKQAPEANIVSTDPVSDRLSNQNLPDFNIVSQEELKKATKPPIDISDTLNNNMFSSIDDTDTPTTAKNLSIDVFDTDIPKKDISIYSTKFKSNFTKLSNHFFSAWKDLTKTEKILYLYFYRNSFGWNKTTSNIPLSTRFLMTALNLSSSSIQAGLASLKAKNLIEELDSSRIGITYKVKLIANGEALTPPINDFFTPLDNNIFTITSKCSVSDVLVYLVIYRLSFGFNQNVTTKKILTSQIAKEIGLSLRRTQDAIRNLLEFSLISRVSDISSHGIQYRVFLPHEVFACETKTIVTYQNTTASTLVSSIDVSDTPLSSIDKNKNSALFSSIDKSDQTFVGKQQQAVNKEIAVTVSFSSTDDPATKEILKTNKTSSGDADDFFNFIKSNLNPQIAFHVSKEKLEGYIASFGLEACKKSLLRLKTRLASASNPVGLWIDSLKNPANYPELTQKSETERVAEERQNYEAKKREQLLQEQARAAEQKQITDFWQTLAPEIQNEFVKKSEESFRQITPNRLPPAAVIRERAMKMATEQKE